MSYLNIFEEIQEKNGKNNFEQNILESLEKAREKNLINGISKMFLEILRENKCTIKEIDMMIEYGADILYKNGRALSYICQNEDSNVVLYYLDKYNFDVNNLKNLGFSFERVGDETLKIIIDKGLVIDDTVLRPLFHGNKSINNFKILIDNGMPIKEFATKFIEFGNYDMRYMANLILKEIIRTNYDFGSDVGMLSELLKFSAISNFSLEEIRTIFMMGASPRYSDDYYLVLCCYYGDINLVLLMINEYGCDINAQNSRALIVSIYHNNYNTTKLLLDMGINITDDAIIASFDKIEFLELLAKYHTDLNHFYELFFKQIIKSDAKYLDTFKFFIQNGMDANHAILNSSLIKN